MQNNTILVIEDNQLNMKLVRGLLSIGKYQVLEAIDAESGIRMAKEQKPDLILMDIQLVGMDGLTATRIIKSDPELNGIPVIALTSFAMEGDEEKALEAGCDYYIRKPIDTKDFLKAINRFFNKTESINELPKETGCNAKILIVDDEPTNVKLLTAKLSRENIETFKAYGGEEALEKAVRLTPDLILLDIMMPDMNGYEVTRRIKNNPQISHIPIILLTALSGSEDKMKGLEAGAEEFLTKPVNTVELMARINSMLRLKQYREQLAIRTESEENFSKTSHKKETLKEEMDLFRVLLVDDDERDIRLIQSILHGQPYKIIVTGNGDDVISLAIREKIDLILLDILLPGLDGFEVCRRLKKMDETRDIQIILITCLRDLESKIKGTETGADDFIVKPIDGRYLRARIMVLLKHKAYLDKLRSHYEIALNSAMKDGLTGLYNQTYFKKFLEFEVKRSIRQRYPTALIMIDLDDFKHYNDTLGHLAGDRIIYEVGRIIKKTVREIDMPARYGGEEFAVVLPYADKKSAFNIAKRIQKAIQSYDFPNETVSPLCKITASMGIAVCPSSAVTTEELIEKADSMLYKAKKEGKNRVCAFD